MKKLFIILMLVSNSMFVHAQGQARIMESLSMESQVLNQAVKYSIILPPDYYTSKKTYPVVYLLHGLGDNESSWLEYGQVSQTVDAAVKKREIIPMIYVMPQGFTNYYVNDYAGKFMYEDMFLKELVPFIDQQYRTVADKNHRATLGYSMGGFGALVLPLRNPDVFSVCVPLSISVRTDAQYMTEDASGWDEQWGRLFGAIGTTGESRLTAYYKKHSPFHILTQPDLTKLKDVKIYIDNGDDEETLCRSNEELHMLLRDRNFPHEFRVRNGGHEFAYWRDALPNGLHFISDAFEGKPYRGDVKNFIKPANVSKSPKMIKEELFEVLLPAEYAQTQRLYPVLYVIGDLDPSAKIKTASLITSSVESGALTPIITVFINNSKDINTEILPAVEKKYRTRNAWRFRSLIGYQEGGAAALRAALVPETFTSCVLFDSPIDCDSWKNAIAVNKKKLERTWVMVYTPDKSKNYSSSGCAHTFLRDEWVHHEYRVQEGKGGSDWFISNLKEALDFTQRKIHR